MTTHPVPPVPPGCRRVGSPRPRPARHRPSPAPDPRDRRDLDLPAVRARGSGCGRCTAAPGAGRGPLTHEQDREDLARHEAEIEAHESFGYALFDRAETALLGCVYVDPPEKVGADAEIVVGRRRLVGSTSSARSTSGAALDRRRLAAAPPALRRAGPRWEEWLLLPDARSGPTS